MTASNIAEAEQSPLHSMLFAYVPFIGYCAYTGEVKSLSTSKYLNKYTYFISVLHFSSTLSMSLYDVSKSCYLQCSFP